MKGGLPPLIACDSVSNVSAMRVRIAHALYIYMDGFVVIRGWLALRQKPIDKHVAVLHLEGCGHSTLNCKSTLLCPFCCLAETAINCLRQDVELPALSS